MLLLGFCILIALQVILVYVAYFLASKGEEVDMRQAVTCGILIAGCSMGASKAMEYTGTMVDLLIWVAYFFGVILAFALVTELPVKNSVIATVIYFVLLVIAQFFFSLIF